MFAILSSAVPSTAGTGSNSPLIKVTGGTDDFQVLQRDEGDQSQAHLCGFCLPPNGVVEARLCDRGVPLAHLDWRKIGEAKNGEWAGSLSGLPIGGPYDLEVRLVTLGGDPLATDAVRSIMVGDLWVLAGQSNMHGVGKVSELPPPMGAVHMFTMDYHWAPAREPLHTLLEARDEAYWEDLFPPGRKREEVLLEEREMLRSPLARCVGPGLPFAWELYRQTHVPVGLIPCARGSTTLEQWSPERKVEGGRSLYGAMLRRVVAAGGTVRGILWYQGESDAFTDESLTYERTLLDLISAVRLDLGNNNLLFLYVQLGRFIVGPDEGDETKWDMLREAQRVAEMKLDHLAVVPAVDVPQIDVIHISTAGQLKIGRRLALQAVREMFDCRDLRRGPRLVRISVNLDHADADRMVISLRFSEVNGRLRAEGRPAGFALANAEGEPVPTIVSVDLPADRHDEIELRVRNVQEGTQLWYGHGMDPYVNITDEQDMGMLAFGPITIPAVGQSIEMENR